MEYAELKQEFNNIRDLIDLEKLIVEQLDGNNRLRYREVIHKTLVIELYTFWENFVKNLVYDVYADYKNLVVNEEFIKRYFKNINENAYLRKKFLDNIQDDKINVTVETLCHSNNLTEKVLKDLFMRINFDPNELDLHLKNAESLREALEKLNESSIQKIERSTLTSLEDGEHVSQDLNISSRQVHNCYDYLNTLVQLRNDVAHNFHVDEIYVLDDFEKFADFMFELCMIILEFSKSQIIKKIIDKTDNSISVLRRLYPKEIFKQTDNGTCIVGVNNFGNKIITLETIMYLYSPSLKIFRIAIVKNIQQHRSNVLEALPYQQVGLELKTNMNLIRSKPHFHLFHFNELKVEYDYTLTI